MNKYEINWPVFVFGLLFSVLETAYFGWNLKPSSGEEMICDGIAFIIVAMSVKKISKTFKVN